MKSILKDNPTRLDPTSAFFNPRATAAFALCLTGVVLGVFSGAAKSTAEGPAQNTTSSAAVNAWSIVTSPNAGSAPSALSAVTCLTASDCWAVGRAEIGHTYANTTLLHWDGNSWQIAPSPSVDQETNGLVAITCLSSSSCWAVGYRIILQTIEVKTLTLHWDGASWQIVSSPNVGTGFNALYGVACASESDCWAVGFENGGSLAQTLIERWDGNSWTIQTSPNVGTEHNIFNAVICRSASDCWAVGYSGAQGARSGLVAHWDGTAWTASALANALLSVEDTLSGVTCNSMTDCWAVGDSYNGTIRQTLIERWNGTSWASTVAPNAGADSYLSDVTCASASDCWAVGHSSNAAVDPTQFDQAMILHWNGSVWLLNTQVPDPTATYASDLAGVVCASGSECWAVGSIQPAGTGRPLIERWDGSSWTSVVAPDYPFPESNYLDGVSCVSASDCWAVGFDFYGTVARSLILHWDGTSWTIKDSPNTALDRSNYVDDVTCVSTSDCWVVGSSTNTIGVEDQALTMHWNGTAWSVVNPAPVDTSQVAETSFRGIACASASDCWAVGFSLTQDYQGLIEHWNGTAWSIVSAPPQEKSILYDVTCTGTSDCTAVGVQWTTALTGSGLYQTLVEHWDGASWSVVTSQNTAPDQDNIFSAVACADASNCWAVGSSNNYSQPLMERWDGSSWTMVSLPQTSTILSAITCVSASDCWAAGPYYTPSAPAQTLLMHWDGASWTIVASPDTSPKQSNYVSGIACASGSECWAVGRYAPGSLSQTLILRYAPTVLPTNVVSRKTHGTAGPFDIDLPLTGTPGIECRSGGSGGNHQVVITFAVPVTIRDATITPDPNGTASLILTPGSNQNEVIASLSNVSNAQTLTINLLGVSDGTITNDVRVPMSVLLGDVNATGRTDSGDVTQVRNKTVSVPDEETFQLDVNTSGRIDAGDVTVTRNASVTVLP